MKKNRLSVIARTFVAIAVTVLALILPVRQALADDIASGTWGTCPWEISSDGVLTVHPGVGESQSDKDDSPWADYSDDITTIIFSEEGGRKVIAPADSSYLFFCLSKVESIDSAGLDVSHVSNMEGLFWDCRHLVQIDVSDWDTSSVTNMSHLFYRCFDLPQIDVSDWDTSSVTDMSSMFNGCYDLDSLDVSGWDTSSVTSTNYMFDCCYVLTTLDLSNWDTSSVTDMSWMFSGCRGLEQIVFSNWDTSSVTNMGSLFYMCNTLNNLDLSNWDTSSVTTMGSMFYQCYALDNLDLSNWDTSSVTSMSAMFCDCEALTSLDLSGWDTSSLSNIENMFKGCNGLITLDLYGWDTSLISSTEGLFYYCYSLTSLDITGWDTTSLQYMRDMFRDCRSLVTLDLSGWNTSQVMSMNSLFRGCSSLVSIYVDDCWSTSSLESWGTDYVFEGCASLVGGNGTTFDSEHTDSEYAHIDLPGSPGYLSDITAAALSQYHFGSVTMTLNGLNYDLLTTERTIDAVAKDTQFSLRAELAADSPRAMVFVLYQVDKDGYTYPIARAGSDGRFGTLTYEQFDVDKTVFINVFDEEGQLVLTSQLLLTVKDSRMDDIPTSFQIGDGVECTFEGWPMEGMRMTFPITDWPITCMISDDGTVQLGINFDVKKAFSSDPSFWTTLHDKGFWRDAFRKAEYNNFLLKSGYKKWVGEPKWGFNTIGYLEGNLTSKVFKGYIAFEVSFGGSWETQVVNLPIVIEISAKGTGSVSAESVFHLVGKKLILDNATLDIGIKGSFGPYVGVGLACVASAGIWGRITVGGTYTLYPEAARGLKEIYGIGEVGLKALVFGRSFSFTLFTTGGGGDSKHYFYKRDTSTRQYEQTTVPSESIPLVLSGIDTGASYEQMDRSYLSSMTEWNGAARADGTVLLQGGGYPYAEVRMVDVEGGQLLVFLTDDTSREPANRTQLVWSRYDASSGIWSEPLPVWDDGTADYYPSICSDGSGGAWVSWSNARAEVTDGLTLEEESALYDVSVAHFSVGSGSFGSQVFLTDDTSHFEVSPNIGIFGDEPVVAWASNPSDDILGLSGTQRIVVSTMRNGSWSTREVTAAPAYVMSVKAGGLDGPAVAWSTDDDGSMETIEDSRTYVWTEEDGTVAIGESHSWNPVFATKDGEPALVWCQDGTLAVSTDGVSSDLTELEFIPRTLFQLSGDIGSDALVTYVRYQDGAGNVFGRMACSGEWGDEFSLTDQDQSVTSWATAGSTAIPTVAFSASTETETTSTETGVWVCAGSGIALVGTDGVWYEGDEGSVVISVRNDGCTPLDSVTVTLSENVEIIGSFDVPIELAPGESGYAIVPFEQPADGVIHTYEVGISHSSDTMQLVLGNPILVAEPLHGITDGGETVGAVVANFGGSATQAGTAVWRDLATGEVLGEADFPSLASGESATIIFAAEGMLFEDGIMSTEIEFSAADADGNELSTNAFVESFAGAIDDELDEDETGGGPWSISEAEIAVILSQEYTGSPLEPKLTVRWMGRKLRLGRDFTVTYADNINVGTATVTITGLGAFEGTAIATFEIVPRMTDISSADVDLIRYQEYTGDPITPDVTVSLDGTVLREGIDYVLSFEDNVEVGEATVIVEGIGYYTGVLYDYFWIDEYDDRIDITSANVDSIPDQAYTGFAIEPDLTVTLDGIELIRGIDYAVTYYDNVEVGVAWLEIEGIGEYEGFIGASFRIVDSSAAPFFIDADPADDANHGAEVDWMGRMGISTGWEVAGGREYRGLKTVLRCDFAAFLYRFADLRDDGLRNDSIALTDAEVEAVLRDVKDCMPKTDHAPEIAWLIKSGISRGWDNGDGTVSFRPYATVARQDMAAFLYRYADLADNEVQDGSPAMGPQQVRFSDVRHGDAANHAAEVEWLASVGVTRGWDMGGGTYEFRGTRTVARQDMAAFMYRLYTYLESQG